MVNEGCPPETTFCETFVITQDCFEIVNTDVNLEDQSITIFPTLTNDQFRIEGLLEAYNIQIIGGNGTIYETLSATGTSLTYDVTSLPSGLYVILISDHKNQHLKLEKILKF